MFCNKCGKENLEDAIFCSFCGSEIGVLNKDFKVEENEKLPGKVSTSLIIGAISIVSYLFFDVYIALILGVIGAIIGFVSMIENPNYEDKRMIWFVVLVNLVGITGSIGMLYSYDISYLFK